MQMKTLYCLIISLLCLVFPFKDLKDYCYNLSNKMWTISEPNTDDKRSISVQILH